MDLLALFIVGINRVVFWQGPEGVEFNVHCLVLVCLRNDTANGNLNISGDDLSELPLLTNFGALIDIINGHVLLFSKVSYFRDSRLSRILPRGKFGHWSCP